MFLVNADISYYATGYMYSSFLLSLRNYLNTKPVSVNVKDDKSYILIENLLHL